MPEETFSLHLSEEDLLQYYRGTATRVSITADSGRVIQFPAVNLRTFISPMGIHGRFRIRFDSRNKFMDLTRIDARHLHGGPRPANDGKAHFTEDPSSDSSHLDIFG